MDSSDGLSANVRNASNIIPKELESLLQRGLRSDGYSVNVWKEIGECFSRHFTPDQFNAADVAIHHIISGLFLLITFIDLFNNFIK